MSSDSNPEICRLFSLLSPFLHHCLFCCLLRPFPIPRCNHLFLFILFRLCFLQLLPELLLLAQLLLVWLYIDLRLLCCSHLLLNRRGFCSFRWNGLLCNRWLRSHFLRWYSLYGSCLLGGVLLLHCSYEEIAFHSLLRHFLLQSSLFLLRILHCFLYCRFIQYSFFLEHDGYGSNLILCVQPHDDDSLRGAAAKRNIFQCEADRLAMLADADQVAFFFACKHESADDVTGFGSNVRRLHACASATLQTVFRYLRHLAETVLHHDEQITQIREGDGGSHHHFIIRRELDPANTCGIASHVADILLREADGLALLAKEEELFFSRGCNDPLQFVSFIHLLCYESAPADVIELGKLAALHRSLFRRHEEELFPLAFL